jgi:hypothetical protein
LSHFKNFFDFKVIAFASLYVEWLAENKNDLLVKIKPTLIEAIVKSVIGAKNKTDPIIVQV